MLESKYSQGRPVFRETFNDEQTVRNNGGVPTDVVFSDGQGVFTNSNIKYNSPPISDIFTIKIKGLSESFKGRFISSRTIPASPGFEIYENSLGYLAFYIEGSNYATTFLVDGTNEIIVVKDGANSKIYVNGISILSFSDSSTLTKLPIYIGNSADLGSFLVGNIDLLEIYNYALTAEQVSNDYNNLTYKDVRDGLVLDIDSRQGVIEDKFGSALTKYNGLSVKKDGNYYHSYNDGTGLGFKTDAIIPETDATINVWMKIINKENDSFSIHHGGWGVGNNNCRFLVNNTANSIIIDSPSQRSVSTNNSTQLWNMYTTTIDSLGNLTQYANGIEVEYIPLNQRFLQGLYFLSYGNSSYYKAKAFQNQQRIYNRALSAEECMQLFTSSKHYYNV